MTTPNRRRPAPRGSHSLVAAAAAALAVALAWAAPASATAKAQVGPQLNVAAGGLQTFPAEQAFHVTHGWLLEAGTGDGDAIGKYDFALTVDGIPVEPDYVDLTTGDFGLNLGMLQFRAWVFNFADGMTGTHTFTGTWSGPCQNLVDSGYPVGPCEKRTAIVGAGHVTATVQFVP